MGYRALAFFAVRDPLLDHEWPERRELVVEMTGFFGGSGAKGLLRYTFVFPVVQPFDVDARLERVGKGNRCEQLFGVR